jgi:hypothetical protein
MGEHPLTEEWMITGASRVGAGNLPKHHVFPQEHRRWFEARGFRGKTSIDKYTVELDVGEHQAIHGGGDWRRGRTWVNEWNARIYRELTTTEDFLGRRLTFDEIMTIGKELMVEYGIDGPFVPYP